MCIAGAIIGGAAIGAVASNSAAKKQAGAAKDAAGMQMDQYNQTRADQADWRTAGSNSLADIAKLQPQFQHQFNADDLKAGLAPNYDWRLAQGQAANQNAAGVSGGLVGGNALKGLQDYTQNAAGDAYQQAFNNYNAQQTNIFNRLSTIAGLGSTANQTTAQAGTAAANNAGNYLTSGAAASAAGTVGASNAVSNGIGNYLGWNYLNRNSSSPTANGGDLTYGASGARDYANGYGPG